MVTNIPFGTACDIITALNTAIGGTLAWTPTYSKYASSYAMDNGSYAIFDLTAGSVSWLRMRFAAAALTGEVATIADGEGILDNISASGLDIYPISSGGFAINNPQSLKTGILLNNSDITAYFGCVNTGSWSSSYTKYFENGVDTRAALPIPTAILSGYIIDTAGALHYIGTQTAFGQSLTPYMAYNADIGVAGSGTNLSTYGSYTVFRTSGVVFAVVL